MTATFGNLDHRTLTLEPGLNVITAPNEWGKSTWCAFLQAMLYGVDTGQKARKGLIPDKEKYKPWSGRPMAGSMELEWQGRRVTIERRTKARVPLGEFRAFETDTGLPVEELTADTCGERLLGVERSVYLRSGFLRQADLPVTQDEALSRRLNALVTTGDDSAAGPALEKQLRDLKNKCQYNKSGLLPQALEALEEKRRQLRVLEDLDARDRSLREAMAELERRAQALEAHQRVLEAQENEKKLHRVQEARQAEQAAEAALAQAERRCQGLCPRQEAERRLLELDRLQEARRDLELEAAMEPPAPEPPSGAPAFAGRTGEEAVRQAEQDLELWRRGQAAARGGSLLLWLLAGICLAGGTALALLLAPPFSYVGFGLLAAALGLGVGALLRQVRQRFRAKRQAALERELLSRYEAGSLEELLQLARDYSDQAAAYAAELAGAAARRQELAARRQTLDQQLQSLSGGDEQAQRRTLLETVQAWDAWADAQRAGMQARRHREAMEAMAEGLSQQAEPREDPLTLPPEETRAVLTRVRGQLVETRSKLDACRGQALALGDRDRIEAQAEALEDRVAQLETYYIALERALAALEQARRTLQSRFAPRITAQAREILGQLTDGRYDRLLWEQDLSLSAGARGEDTLRPALWRSDGTADQLYLALRLAVSRELLGDEAPLVLDDALIRFDDRRLAAALDLLRREGRRRQILLFTCQGREAACLPEGAPSQGPRLPGPV